MFSLLLIISFVAAYEIDMTKSNDELFEEFKMKFNKIYKNEEDELERKSVFIRRIEGMKKFNEKYPTMKLEITKGLDNLKEEFHYTTGHIDDFKNDKLIKKSNLFRQSKIKKSDNIPENYSCCIEKTTDVDLCGDIVINQKCGSCWAASTAHYIQMEYAKKTYEKNKKAEYVLPSVQQFIDCTEASYGCAGGQSRMAYVYNEYVTLDEDYPYLSGEEYCMKETYVAYNLYDSILFPIDANIKELKNELDITETTEKHSCRYFRGEEIKTPIKLLKTGDNIDTTEWSKEEKINKMKEVINERGYFLTSMYASDNFKIDFSSDNKYDNDRLAKPYVDDECPGKPSNHAVLIDGYGKYEGEEFFWLRNSWGAEWGNKGHMKISTKQLCNVGDYILFFDTEIQSSNVKGSYGILWYEDSEDSSSRVTSNGGIIQIAIGIVLLMILM